MTAKDVLKLARDRAAKSAALGSCTRPGPCHHFPSPFPERNRTSLEEGPASAVSSFPGFSTSARTAMLDRQRGGLGTAGRGGGGGAANPGQEAEIKAGLLPGPADGQVPGHPLGHGPGARECGGTNRSSPP